MTTAVDQETSPPKGRPTAGLLGFMELGGPRHMDFHSPLRRPGCQDCLTPVDTKAEDAEGYTFLSLPDTRQTSSARQHLPFKNGVGRRPMPGGIVRGSGEIPGNRIRLGCGCR
jgi:hypothetical protein